MTRAIIGTALRAPLWLGMIALDLALSVIGLFVCAIAPSVRLTDPADRVERTHWRWRSMWIWDNGEDGVDGLPGIAGKNPNWRADTASWSRWRRRWVWSAWRNRVNNMRFTRLGRSPDYPEPPKKHTFAYLTTGPKFWLCVPLTNTDPWWELWLGWKPNSGFKSTITSLGKPGA